MALFKTGDEMPQSNGLARLTGCALILAVILALGYPIAFMATHGLNHQTWPDLPNSPFRWFSLNSTVQQPWSELATRVAVTYAHMAIGQSDAFADGGWAELLMIIAAAVLGIVLVMARKTLEPLRHAASRRFGDARFASPRELGRMRQGLELGLNPHTGEAVRVRIEGNLFTIAPPRTGKSAGLIVPNLAYPEPGAWAGPALVIDPKGDVIRIVRRRREQMGRTVRVIDPLAIAGPQTDRWNPMLGLKANEVLDFMSMGWALLPEAKTTNEASAFFRGRAATLIAAALQAAVQKGDPTLATAADLLSDKDALLAALGTTRIAKDARGLLTSSNERTSGDVIETAKQAFEWQLDDRMQAVITNPTFSVDDLCRGDVDLFIVLPADTRRRILAPFARLLLADVFRAVRKQKPAQRIVAFIDEASNLGRFEVLVDSAAELPGRGISLWTFWQSEAQINEAYGDNGASTLKDTAEVTMLFNLLRAREDECARWSRALGTFTAVEETVSQSPGQRDVTRTWAPVSQDLVAPAELAGLTQTKTLVFLTSRYYTTNPLQLSKTLAHEDSRFEGLIDNVAPAARL